MVFSLRSSGGDAEAKKAADSNANESANTADPKQQSSSKNNASNPAQELGVLFGLKVIRIMVMLVSLSVTNNYMSQIYMEKVLVNNELPPSLTNFVYLFMMVDVFLNLILLLILKFITNLKGDALPPNILRNYVVDYIFSMMFIFIFGAILSSIVQSKKYFLYKDDGLRALRAFKEMMTYIGIIYNFLPIQHMIQGAVQLLQSATPVEKK